MIYIGLGGILPWTWVATSGTTPLVRIPRSTHFVSLDGANAWTHDAVRRSPGLFDRIVKNLREARKDGNFPIHVHTVLNRMNFLQVEEIVKRCCILEDLADTVTFSMHTPMLNKQDQHLCLDNSDRRLAIDSLLGVRQKYPQLVSMSESMVRHYETESLGTQRAATCPTARYVNSFRENGERIPQCIFGPEADCSGCGCVVSGMVKSLIDQLDLQTARTAGHLIPLCE